MGSLCVVYISGITVSDLAGAIFGWILVSLQLCRRNFFVYFGVLDFYGGL